jgi:hypothetical protein
MSLEMAHKVIVPQKKIISRSFLNSGTLIVNTYIEEQERGLRRGTGGEGGKRGHRAVHTGGKAETEEGCMQRGNGQRSYDGREWKLKVRWIR